MTSQLEGTRWANSRKIAKRIVITGTLVLETPTQLSNGDADGAADMSLLRDPLTGKALLTGTSMAGALRSYLRRRELGYRKKAERESQTADLFGPHTQRTDANFGDAGDSEQSYLITQDALSEAADAQSELPITELRDGVAIDPKTRTAEDGKKYDMELLAAGTRFPLRFELLIPEGDEKESKFKQACAVALSGLENGDIRLGARKRRGFGQCSIQAPGWSVVEYDLTEPGGLTAWLEESGAASGPNPVIGEALGVGAFAAGFDDRDLFTLTATFALDSSLLIRSGSDDPGAPDMVHLKSLRNGKLESILSGTSLTGALRARGLRIANTVGQGTEPVEMIDCLFGKRIEGNQDKPVAGRLWVDETVVEDPLELVVTRVKIDRFTGGSYPGALFNQQPLFGTDKTQVTVRLKVENPTGADVGLLLLLLKDLWTKDLPLGGEASVGRGRLAGRSATLTQTKKGSEAAAWTIAQDGDRLEITGDRNALQQYVNQFVAKVGGQPAGEVANG